jgi:hypothetical protein
MILEMQIFTGGKIIKSKNYDSSYKSIVEFNAIKTPEPKKTLEIESPFVDIFAEPPKETDWLLFKEKVV